jgi:hypothetical protein
MPIEHNKVSFEATGNDTLGAGDIKKHEIKIKY